MADQEPVLLALQPITSTCEPRKDVLSGTLSDEHSAADLDHVVRDPDSDAVIDESAASVTATAYRGFTRSGMRRASRSRTELIRPRGAQTGCATPTRSFRNS